MDTSSKRECMKIIKRKKTKRTINGYTSRNKKKKQDKCLYRENIVEEVL